MGVKRDEHTHFASVLLDPKSRLIPVRPGSCGYSWATSPANSTIPQLRGAPPGNRTGTYWQTSSPWRSSVREPRDFPGPEEEEPYGRRSNPAQDANAVH